MAILLWSARLLQILFSSERLQKQYSVAAPDPLLLVQTLEIIYSVAVPDPLLLVQTLEIIYSVAVPDPLLLVQTLEIIYCVAVPDPLLILVQTLEIISCCAVPDPVLFVQTKEYILLSDRTHSTPQRLLNMCLTQPLPLLCQTVSGVVYSIHRISTARMEMADTRLVFSLIEPN